MKIIETNIPDLILIEPTLFIDTRGYFFESFNQKQFEEKVGNINFVQDNEAKSSKGVLRGLHFQTPPFDQAKLVRCVEGEILDVAVDLRSNSAGFKKVFTTVLSGENKRQLFIPRGFAHGYIVISESAIFSYKVDNYYSGDHDTGIAWNDPDLAIDWQIPHAEIILSEKDKLLRNLSEIKNPFK